MRALLVSIAVVACLVGCNGDYEPDPEVEFAFTCGRGDMTAVTEGLAQGRNPNGVDSTEGLPLLMALIEGHWEIAEFLVDNGADVNANYEGYFLLDFLIDSQGKSVSEKEHKQHQAAIDWLYDHGARRPPT